MIRGVVLDVDGTVVRGAEPLAGAREGIAAIDDAGLERLFVTNNPTRSAAAYADRLSAAGIEADAASVLTAGDATAAYLRERHPDAQVAVLGEPGLVEQLADAGIEAVAVEAAADPDACVVSIDREFDYERLTVALDTVGDDVTFVGTDPDVVIPGPDGDVPGSGAIVNAVAGVVGREPDAVLGKPSATTRDLILDRLGLEPAEILVVGDRLDTDVALGAEAGAKTALVRTGVEGSDDRYDPDFEIESLGEIGRVLAAMGVD